MHKITAEELAENPKKYYGKYVNYGVDLDGNSETSDWQLFYVGGSDTNDSDDVKGRIYLIAADYVPMNNSTLKEAMGDGTSKAMMMPVTESEYEALSAFWGEGARKYQELTELNPDPTKLFMHEGYDLSSKRSTPNSAVTSTLLNTENWKGFAKGKYGEVAIGGPTIEMWCKAWNQVVDEADGFRKVYANGNGLHGYYVGESEEQTDKTNYYITSGGSAFDKTQSETVALKYNVFFSHITTKIESNGTSGMCEFYWLASPSGGWPEDMFRVCCYGNIYIFNSFSSKSQSGLRPLVCLEEGVRLQKNTSKSNDTKTVYDIVK